jgi:hypothetical protein
MTSFYIGLPSLSEKWKHFLLASLIAIIIVLSVVKTFQITTGIIIILFILIIYLLITSSTGQDLEGSLPSTTYPIPPHLGLDGVDLVNQI